MGFIRRIFKYSPICLLLFSCYCFYLFKEPAYITSRQVSFLKEEMARHQRMQNNVFAFLKIENTSIDYPVMQSADDDYYLNHDMLGNEFFAGSLFVDAKQNIQDERIIVYGHNTGEKLMFGELVKYHQFDFRKEHPFLLFNDDNYEVFAVIEDDNQVIKEVLEGNLEMILSRNMYPDLPLPKKSQLLFLMTCATCDDFFKKLLIIAYKL